MIPPVFALIRVGKHLIPVPVIVLWPLFLLALVLAPLVLPFVDMKGFDRMERALLPFHLWKLLSALSGSSIDVRSTGGTHVQVQIW